MEKYSEEQINEKLKGLSSWKLLNGKIQREYVFSSFLEAMNFVDLLVPIFEELQHHPEMRIVYNKVVFELWTHDVGGITKKDLTTALSIERSFEELNSSP